MTDLIPNLDGSSRIYAVFGDPIAQVQTPALINPLFAAAGRNLFAVPFHVTAAAFPATWDALAALPNIAGIGVTVPHKIAAAQRCDTLTDTARAVGAVNSIQRDGEGRLHGALFDGVGFVAGLGDAAGRLRNARVLMVGAGGAGRAIAHALAAAGVARLDLMDLSPQSIADTAAIANVAAGQEIAFPAEGGRFDHDVIVNASPIGLKGDARFPVPEAALEPGMLVADIAALGKVTPLLKAARRRGCATSDGHDMLTAQIAIISGFAAGLPAGTALVA